MWKKGIRPFTREPPGPGCSGISPRLKIYGKQGLELIRSLYEGFQETMKENAIGSISEIYEGDPPHRADGASSFAASVAEVLRMHVLMEKLEKQNNK